MNCASAMYWSAAFALLLTIVNGARILIDSPRKEVELFVGVQVFTEPVP